MNNVRTTAAAGQPLPAAPPAAPAAIPKAQFDWRPLALLAAVAAIGLPLIGSPSTWITLTVAGLAMGLIIFIIASGLTLATGTKPEQVISAMSRVAPVRGRLERAVITRSGAPVYVDYAHTPDAIEAAIQALRSHVEGRLIIMFGAGGDRDKGKRPEMGAIASRLADVVIVTDDNPRTEDPAKIRSEILAAAPGAIEIAGRQQPWRAATPEGRVALRCPFGERELLFDRNQVPIDVTSPRLDLIERAQLAGVRAEWHMHVHAEGIRRGKPGRRSAVVARDFVCQSHAPNVIN
jgi:hypothetical protein